MMNKYSREDIKKLVDLYYGDKYVLNINMERTKRGSDVLFERMENFLKELDDAGLEIIPKERSGCLCGRSE